MTRDDEARLFEEAMAGVERVEGPRPVLRRKRTGSGAVAEGVSGPGRALPRLPRFRVERDGARVSGLAEGRRPRTLTRLKGGAFPIEHRVDLHGFTEAEAQREVEAELLAAWRGRRRCVLVIHGRGRGSVAAPVLKEALPGWLTAAPLAPRVVAFTTAPDRLGGLGATLVLLTPRRQSAPQRGGEERRG